ncbi:MAG: von Willebrand factor type A domain-containing protein, partial [Kiritimatiellae bacterium]|nr:von Willebrand factor type A domain-containing protein [Kiritimatiellia bacterium]
MNTTFEQEWNLYREGGARRPFEADRRPAEGGAFDAPVRAGEIRLFADMKRPFAALVAEDRGAPGWLLVPVSPFTVPASPRERLAGERVFQLWNACTASRRFVERSWRVDTLGEADRADLLAAAKRAAPGRLSKTDGGSAVAQYEREFLVAGGNFVPLFRREPARSLFARPAFRAAAALAVCCGIAVFLAKKDAGGRLDNAVVATPATEERHAETAESAETEATGDKYSSLYVEPAVGRFEGLADEADEDEADIEWSDEEADEAAEASAASAAPEPAEVTSVTFVRSPIVIGGAMAPAAAAAPAPSAAVRGNAVVRRSLAPGATYHREAWNGQYDSGLAAGDRLVLGRAPMAVPAAERYAEFWENEFLDPKATPLSTFSLDVDTTSYALMRREIAEGKRLPPRTSVRLEEFVNYFRYDYPQPADGRPLAVSCEAAPCPWNPAHRLARVALQAKELDKGNIPPCNLVFLVDVSGSMSWHGGIDMAKKGLSMLVGELRDEDRVAIVTYANGTDVRLPSTPGTDKARILGVIDSLMAGGGTAGGAGIRLAYEEARKNFDAKRNNRVVLVTDGDFNIGISSPKELEDFIAEKRASGVFLTVVGVGEGNYQDATMKKLASAGNGNYAYVDSLLEAKKVFLTEFGGTLQTVAKDVKLQVEFNPAQVAAYRLLGYENRRLADKDFNDDRKDAGEIGSGHSMTAFYEIVPAGSGEEAVASVDPLKYQKTEGVESGDLFTVKLRWKAPDGDTSELAETPFAAAAATETPSEDFRFASAVAEFALLLEDSKFKGTASFSNVLSRARTAKGADEEGWRAEFIRLVEAAEIYSDRNHEVLRYRNLPLPRQYEVGEGPDGGTLSGIAALFYGDASLWPLIRDANPATLPDPNVVRPGQ